MTSCGTLCPMCIPEETTNWPSIQTKPIGTYKKHPKQHSKNKNKTFPNKIPIRNHVKKRINVKNAEIETHIEEPTDGRVKTGI